eukprot:COSAG05_NODE_23826_length_255_cov_0.974359_1_plen_61_part_10
MSGPGEVALVPLELLLLQLSVELPVVRLRDAYYLHVLFGSSMDLLAWKVWRVGGRPEGGRT